MKLQGKVAIVTGAGHGIGRAIALELAREGADIAVVDINEELAKGVVKELAATGTRALPIEADVSKSQQVGAMVETVLAQFGKVDILVNNAGGNARERVSEFKDSTEEIWDFVLARNLKGVLNCSRAVINHMIERKSGAIVSIASFVGILGGPGMADYSAAKAGIIGFTKALAKEVGRYGIRVNAVSPGAIDTGRFEAALKNRPRLAIVGGSMSKGALRRFGKPEEVANVVRFLVSDDASYVTGQNYAVCGGASIAAGASIVAEEMMWGGGAS